MVKLTTAIVALWVLALSGTLAAQAKPEIVQRIPPATNADDPATMFREYCAACHGPQGKGNGPAAAALKTVPADLTRISARNDGKFPDVKVKRYIEGLDQIAAHGSRDMPVWGQLFRTMPGGQSTVPLRVQQLSDYIKSLQQ
jgi:mono/diheme cytochrome c family protein